MPLKDRRSEILRALRPDERLAAVEAALRSAPPEELELLVTLLIELVAETAVNGAPGRTAAVRDRQHQASVRALAFHWRRVPLGLRQLGLAAGRGRWGSALRGIDGEALNSCGRSIAELAIDACDPAILPLLAEILDRGEGESVAAAAHAMLTLAIRLAGEEDAAMLGVERQADALRPILDPEVAPWKSADFASFLGVVAGAVDRFDSHRRKELLLAALLLLEHPRFTGRVPNPLRELVRNPDSSAGNTLRGAFRRARAPIARRRAWLWLREPAVAPACVERLARAPTVGDHAAVLPLAHLALAPARSRHMAMIPLTTRHAQASELPPGVEPGGRRLHPDGPAPDRVALQLLGFTARRQTPRFVAGLDGDSASRELALDPLLADPDPVARMAAARLLGGRAGRDYCFDGCEPIARHAALGASSAGIAESTRLRAGSGARRRYAAGLMRSAHASVRWIAREDSDRLAPGCRGAACALAARRAFDADPSSFVDWVRDTVRSGETGSAIEAMMTCRRIRAIAEIEPLALSIIRDSLGTGAAPEQRLVATAVACLGDLRAGRVVGVLAECLRRHADPRVRANAAEGLGRCRRAEPCDGLLVESASDDHHRVRASALRTLMLPWPEPRPGREAAGIAADSLASMLLDERAAHRLAGVWAVQRSLTSGLRGLVGRRWDELAARVRWLAGADRDAVVRSRAAFVTARLDAAIAGLGPRSAGEGPG